MAKLGADEKVPKGVKSRVWRRERVILEFGTQRYIVEPATAERTLLFKDLFDDLFAGVQGFEDKEEVTADDAKSAFESLVDAPYRLLKVLVPDLEEEDVKTAPWPQIWHNFQVLIELNGLKWAQELAKEYLLPLLPSLLRLGLVALQARVEGEKKAREMEAEASGETSG